VILLDRLPWPWGENVLAAIYLAKSLVRGGRFRRALEWASKQTEGRSARWRLAARLCSCYGRFVARLMLVGFRDPDHLRAQVILRGEEHLQAAAGRGAILLGFHLGPPGAAIALRVRGHRLTWARGWGDSQGGLRPAWRRFHEEGEMLSLDGGLVYITGDGGKGREAFKVPVPARPIVIRSGWLALVRHTGAITLPVLTHLEGHNQVVTIHPALPAVGKDPTKGLDACRAALGQILERYVREHPDQCYSLVFRRRMTRTPGYKRPPRRPGPRKKAPPRGGAPRPGGTREPRPDAGGLT
jgi:lauroyl/myristoyl acyltransferase